MKNVLIPFLSALLLFGCSQNDSLNDLDLQDNPASKPVRTAAQKAILKYIGRKSPKSRSAEDVSLIPYIVDGDTVMYLANYGDGWELFSNDLRAPMVLMRSDEGSLYPGFIDNPSFKAFFDNTAETLAVLKEDDTVNADSIGSGWDSYISLYNEDNGWGNDEDPNDPHSGYSYECVGGTFPVTTEGEYTPQGGRLNTKWGQSNPYNQYIPFFYSEDDKEYVHGLAGCVGIATAQYLYWHHRQFGTPVATVDSAAYNSSKNRYSFYGQNSEIWNQFYDEDKSPWMYYNLQQMAPTALFIGYIAHEVGTDFGLEASGAYTMDGAKLIARLTDVPFTNTYSSTAGNIRKILNAGYPLLCESMGGTHSYVDNQGNPVSKGFFHAYLIDYMKVKVYRSEDYYAYVPVKEGDDTEEAPDYDPWSLTLEELREIYGQVDVEVNITTDNWVKMNWGWKGSYDNVEINYDLNKMSFGSGNEQFSNIVKPRIFYPSKIQL